MAVTSPAASRRWRTVSPIRRRPSVVLHAASPPCRPTVCPSPAWLACRPGIGITAFPKTGTPAPSLRPPSARLHGASPSLPFNRRAGAGMTRARDFSTAHPQDARATPARSRADACLEHMTKSRGKLARPDPLRSPAKVVYALNQRNIARTRRPGSGAALPSRGSFFANESKSETVRELRPEGESAGQQLSESAAATP